MSIVRIRRGAADEANANHGGAMDREIVRRRLPLAWKAAIGGAVLLFAALGFFWFAPRGDSQTIDASRLAVSEVTRGTFDDFVPLRARVTPLLTVYIDAVEGGRVEKMLVEDGATVAKDQLIAMLSNPDLQLSTLRDQAEVEQQINSMRSQELALSQTRLANERAVLESRLALEKARRQYDREKPLAAKGFVPTKTFADTSDQFDYERKRLEVAQRTQANDEKMQSSQLDQLRASASSLQSSLAIAHANLDALNLRAPVAGQLSGFNVQVGQSLQRGERIGQIDSPGHNKLIAGVDEFYLGRVAVGQKAELETGGQRYRAQVTKIYPQVQNGQFQIDLQFIGAEPQGVQRGQTLQVRLTLGDPSPARLIPNGAFYNETGGAWIFVVAPDGRSAVKRQVRLGRRNENFIEVLDGLDPGERVITSPYTGFADKDRLVLANP